MNLATNIPSQILPLINLIHVYGYYIIFPLIIVEGPGTIFITGFFVSLGYLDAFTAYIVIVAADLFGDMLYYSAGRWWVHKISASVLGFFKISQKHFVRFEETFKKHNGKIMFFGKLSSFIGGLVMYVAGYVNIPIGRFLYINGAGALFKTLLLLAAGYYFGSSFIRLGSSLDLVSTLALLTLSALMFAAYFGITYFANKYLRKAEK